MICMIKKLQIYILGVINLEKINVGCRFTLSVMSDNFIDIILGALNEVDMSKVQRKTDRVSTFIEGTAKDVFGVVQAVYKSAGKSGKHIVLNATFSTGQHEEYFEERKIKPKENMSSNQQLCASFPVSTQFSLYPLDTPHYVDIIKSGIGAVKQQGVFAETVPFATALEGDVDKVFASLYECFMKSVQQARVVMTVNMSAHSPSSKR